MKINANSVKVGNVIEFEKQLWKVVKRDHVKPGKGGAYIQIELKNLNTGNKTNTRFSSSADVEVAFVEQKNYQFQYLDQDDLVVMDMEDFDTVNISKSLLGDSLPFVQDGMSLRVEYCNDKAVAVYLPDHIDVTIAQADSVVKGQTASSSYKPAVLDNGAKIMVPPFIASGEIVTIHTDDFSYVSRAKK